MRNIPSDSRGKMELVKRIMEQELTELQRQTLVDYYIRGMTMTEIARARSVTPSTVYRTLTRGMARIWRFLLLDPEDCKKIVNSPGKIRQKLAKSGKNGIISDIYKNSPVSLSAHRGTDYVKGRFD